MRFLILILFLVSSIAYPATTYFDQLIVKTSVSAGTNVSALRHLTNGTTTASGNGLYTPATNSIAISTSGSERLRVNSSGFVGIATTNPGSALDVYGTLRLSGSASGYVGIAPASAAGSTTYTLPSADGTNGQALLTNGSGTLSWGNPGTLRIEYAIITNNGSVCASTNNSGSWIVSLSRPGTGACTITTSGWTSAPSCTIIEVSNVGSGASVLSADTTTTTISFQTLDNTGNPQNKTAHVHCIGLK